MRIIKLNAIDSTNVFMRQLSTAEKLKDYTIVATKLQTEGKGQMGTVWQSQKGKNLMFSVFKDVSFLHSDYAFFISIVSALSVVTALKRFNIPKLKVKWPNDILSEEKKVCGILIENVLSNNQIKESIIGIGLNVNQTEFQDLPQASSLLLISGKVYNLDELLDSIISQMKHYLSLLKNEKYSELLLEYETLLFRKEKPSTFKDTNENLFAGIIQGITLSGSLKILLEDDILKTFDLKEVSLLY